jgi:hypothetical protein
MIPGIVAAGVPVEAAEEPAFWSRVVRVELNATTGNQDITVPGLTWTPKAARFLASYATSSANPTTSARASVGASDGTDQFVCCFASGNGVSHNSNNVYRRGATDAVIMIITPGGGGVDIEAGFSAFIAGGVRVNVGTTNARAVYVTVELFGGTALQAKAGTLALAAQNSTSTATVGFEPDAILIDSHVLAFNDTAGLAAITTSGFCSWDGSTIRQASHYYRSDSTSTTNVRGLVRDAAAYCMDTGRYAEVTAINSTQFVMTSRGADLSTFATGYLAFNFGGEAEAWAGVLDTPTATGNHDFTGPSFTPEFVGLRPSMLASVNTEEATGQGGGWGQCSITPAAQYSNTFRDRDNVSGTSAETASRSDASPALLMNHTGDTVFDSSLASFLSNGIRLNFSAVSGTARKWPALFIGS